MHPIGAAAIDIFAGGAAAAIALLHGTGNGILTIARGTLLLTRHSEKEKSPCGSMQVYRPICPKRH